MSIKFSRSAVTLLLLASCLMGITSLMMSFPEGEAQYNPSLTPTRYAGPVTIYRTVRETLLRTVVQLRTAVQLRTIRQTLHETIYGVRTPNAKCSNVTIAWTVSISNFGLPSNTSSISVTGWNNTSLTQSNLGLIASSPGLGPQSPSAWPILGAGAVAGAAVTVASMLLGQRIRRPKIS